MAGEAASRKQPAEQSGASKPQFSWLAVPAFQYAREGNRPADIRPCNLPLTSVCTLVHESFQRDAVLSLKSGGRGGDAAIAEETLRTAPRTAEKTWLRRCWNTNWKTKVVFRDSNPPGN